MARGREAFDHRAWIDAFTYLSSVDDGERLPAEDLERLGIAAFLIGRDESSDVAWERAYREWLGDGNLTRAAGSVFWLAFGLLDRGEMTRGPRAGSRASRLLEDNDLDCAERGYVLIPVALRHLAENEAAVAYAVFEQAGAIAVRFGDTDLTT